jgi:hypothetical protein
MKSTTLSYFSVGLLAVTSLAFAQDQTPRKWRSVDDPPPADVDQNSQNQGNSSRDQGQFDQAPPAPVDQRNDNYGVPTRLTIRPGTYVTIRVNQWLSSDKNQQGDSFSGTLAKPIVVDGIVVAQRGETVGGRVSEAQKAGRVEGTSHLGLQLTELTLADGQQVPLQTQLINRTGSTSTGRDAGAVAGTTALGAVIGAGADYGRGAAIGAGAGAAAGIVGVLLTRGRPTVVYPESELTFRVEAPVSIATDRAPQAFRYVDPQDYERSQAPAPRQVASSCYDCAPPPPPAYYYGPGYGYGYPYYYPGFSVYVGPRYGHFYGPRYRGGYYRGYRR